MTLIKLAGISGNLTRPSKTHAFATHVASEIRERTGASQAIYDLVDLGPSFPTATRLADLDDQARGIVDQLLAADLLIAGSPTYKGSYTGLFKHLFDLLPPDALRGKPVVLIATGGGERHSLVVEHQLRPLFGFFEAFTLPTAIYASEQDFDGNAVLSDLIRSRIARSVDEAAFALGQRRDASLAA